MARFAKSRLGQCLGALTNYSSLKRFVDSSTSTNLDNMTQLCPYLQVTNLSVGLLICCFIGWDYSSCIIHHSA